MPEVNPVTGNMFETQGQDLLVSVRDILQTPPNWRLSLNTYGWPIDSWPQILYRSQTEFETITRNALAHDTRVDSVEFAYDWRPAGGVTITVNSALRYELRF